MKKSAEIVLTVFLLTALVFLAIAGSVKAYPTGPPPGVTGGFGEPACNQDGCHVSYELNAGRAEKLGDVVITGFPERYEAGKTYPVKLTITHDSADRAVFGFQLAVRSKESGTQAGELNAADASTQVIPDKGIQYAEQTLEGTLSNVFEFNWVAPAAPAGELVVNAAANAGSGDGSPEEDYIYTTSIAISPVP